MYMPLIAALICAAAETPAPVAAAAADAAEAAPPLAEKPRKEKTRKGKPPMAGVVNVNRASTAELRLLPGIGRKRAEQIVERRDKKPFTSVDEVGRLKGMHNVVHKIRAYLVVQGDTTLHPVRP